MAVQEVQLAPDRSMVDAAASAFGGGLPPAMSLWFDDRMFARANEIALKLSRAEGFVPAHLIGKPEACFAVVERSLTWRLSPYAVAGSTYETPNRKVGFEGKLCQAILENSGHLVGPVRYIHFWNVVVQMKDPVTKAVTTSIVRSTDAALTGMLANGGTIVEQRDWSHIQGKFRKATSQKGNVYPQAAWNEADEAGLGVIVRAQVRGEKEPREWPFLMVQAFPRNSTLWATDPMTQICYTAVRRFASVAAPGLFMGVPFDHEDAAPVGPDHAVDITPPRPNRADFTGQAADVSDAPEPEPEPRQTFDLITPDGEELSFDAARDAAVVLWKHISAAGPMGADSVNGIWNSNGLLLTQLRERGHVQEADDLNAHYTATLDKCRAPATPATDYQALAKKLCAAIKAASSANQVTNLLQGAAWLEQCHDQASEIYEQTMEYATKRQNALRPKEEAADKFPGDRPML